MRHILHKFFFIITVTTLLALLTSPSYAKEEGDKKPKTSTVKKDKTSKDTKETSKKKESQKKTEKTENKDKSTTSASGSSKKDSDSTSKKGSEKPEKKTGKSNDKPASKESNGSKDKGDKDSKSTKNKSSRQSATTTSKTKKQYKNITVNLNKADAKTFSHYLMGIGEKRAKAIVAYRSSKGKFKDIKELLKVEGIGDKIFDGLKKNVSLSTGETSPPKGGKSNAK